MNLDFEKMTDDDLLNQRICDLPIQIQGTWLEECIHQLYQELEERGIIFRPKCYLSDEWLTPQKETCIGIPFYLAHQALIRLEKKFMIDAEGETISWCMKLLRHETGHALSYAYKFYKRKKWQKFFGPSSAEYGETYKYRPYSKNYVRHLDGFYAQYHPDEDFVETFAVWLTPGFDWEKQYTGWRALQKLKYVDQLMKEIRGTPPLVKNQHQIWRLSTLRITLKNYYKKKRQFSAEDFPDFHDAFLTKFFVQANSENKKFQRAYEVIRKYRRPILSSVSKFSGEKKYIVDELLGSIQKRSRELKLVNLEDESSVVIHISAYITSLIMNYLYTGKFRGEKQKRKKK